MPQANGNVSPERFIEPQPQRQSAVQIAIKNTSPVWYVYLLYLHILSTRLLNSSRVSLFASIVLVSRMLDANACWAPRWRGLTELGDSDTTATAD